MRWAVTRRHWKGGENGGGGRLGKGETAVRSKRGGDFKRDTANIRGCGIEADPFGN